MARADDRVVPETRIESARGVALGTGMRSSSAGTQAGTDNTSNLVLGGVYQIESFFGYQPTFKRIGWGASIADSMTSRLAAGASVRGLFGDNDAGDNKGWEARIGLGFPLSDMISIGIAGRYARLTLSDDRAIPEHPPDPEMPDMKPDQTFRLKGFTMDASITLRPVPGLSISALGYNLLDMETPLAPMLVGGALAFTTSAALSIGGDVLVDLDTADYFDGPKLLAGGGVEFLAQGSIPLRVGYLFDQGREQHGVTAGFGYLDPRVGVQLSLRQIVAGGKETTLMAAVQYFVQ